jgi:hypothetical protein
MLSYLKIITENDPKKSIYGNGSYNCRSTKAAK